MILCAYQDGYKYYTVGTLGKSLSAQVAQQCRLSLNCSFKIGTDKTYLFPTKIYLLPPCTTFS